MDAGVNDAADDVTSVLPDVLSVWDAAPALEERRHSSFPAVRKCKSCVRYKCLLRRYKVDSHAVVGGAQGCVQGGQRGGRVNGWVGLGVQGNRRHGQRGGVGNQDNAGVRPG